MRGILIQCVAFPVGVSRIDHIGKQGSVLPAFHKQGSLPTNESSNNPGIGWKGLVTVFFDAAAASPTNPPGICSITSNAKEITSING